MGHVAYDRAPAARELFERADAVLQRPLSKLCFEGPIDELSQTVNAQPAIYVTSLACLAAARASGGLPESPAFVAGHSLGEYTALAAAGALDFDAGLRLVDTRGRVTQTAADASPGGMAALLGLDEEVALAVCAETGAELCNINAPGQVVIGGERASLERACVLALERGARRAIALKVGGAFHTSAMAPAVDAMTLAVAEARLRAPAWPVVTNDTAEPQRDPAALGRELVYQLTHPVRWVQCVERMTAEGVATFIEVGPSKVLTGLIKRIAPNANLQNVDGTTAAR